MRKKGYCIICRNDNQDLSDEHVIPEAIGGYYHIYCVCKDCNSKLGKNVDKLLMDHWFIKAARYEKGLKGYSGKIPNPLIGEGILSTGEKVRLEQDDKGKMSIRLIPSTIVVSDSEKSFNIRVDIKDEKTIPKIQAKILKRNKLDSSNVQIISERQVVKIDNPEIKMQFTIDMKEYKLGLLKIAYEFAVDKINGYLNDPIAIKYANILCEGAPNKLEDAFIEGDAITNGNLKILESIIDNSNTDRHILLLFNFDGKLYCLIKLFNKFCQMIRMSDSSYGEDGFVLIAINDFRTKKIVFYDTTDLLSATKYNEYTTFKLRPEAQAYLDQQKYNEGIGFACNEALDNLLFDPKGNIVCTESQLLLILEKLNFVKNSQYNENEISVTYIIPTGYHYLCMPEKVLLMVEEITKVNKFQKI